MLSIIIRTIINRHRIVAPLRRRLIDGLRVTLLVSFLAVSLVLPAHGAAASTSSKFHTCWNRNKTNTER